MSWPQAARQSREAPPRWSRIRRSSTCRPITLVPEQPIGRSAGLAITRISRMARTPQTLAQAMAQTQTNVAANTGHSLEPADTSLFGVRRRGSTKHSARHRAAAVLKQAIVSFAGGGSTNLAPSQDHEASDKASLTASQEAMPERRRLRGKRSIRLISRAGVGLG